MCVCVCVCVAVIHSTNHIYCSTQNEVAIYTRHCDTHTYAQGGGASCEVVLTWPLYRPRPCSSLHPQACARPRPHQPTVCGESGSTLGACVCVGGWVYVSICGWKYIRCMCVWVGGYMCMSVRIAVVLGCRPDFTNAFFEHYLYLAIYFYADFIKYF